MTFEADHIRVHLTDGTASLLEGVRYEASRDATGLKVRIRHRLPEKPGGVSAAGGAGVIDLRLGGDGWLRPFAQRFEDGITGSVRVPLRPAPYVQMLTLRSCAAPWPEGGAAWLHARAPQPPPSAIRGREAS